MTLTTIIKLLEAEQGKLDKALAQASPTARLSDNARHTQLRLSGALLLLYRIRDGVPLTMKGELEP